MIYTVIDDVLDELKMKTYVDVDVTRENEYYILEFRHKQIPDTHLKVEVETSPTGQLYPTALVLERKNVGRRTMVRIMDALVNRIAEENIEE